MSPSPPEASTAGDSFSDVVMSAVDHSADQISQKAIEQLEMPHRSPPPDGFELIDFDDHEEEKAADAAELMAGVEEADVSSLGSSGVGSGPDEVATLKLADDSYDFIELDKLRISVSADDEDYPDQQQQVMNKRDRSEDDNMTATSSEISREDQLLLYLLFLLFKTEEKALKTAAEHDQREHPPGPRVLRTSSSFGTAFCGAGGNTIQFSLMPSTALVYAVDIDLRKIELTRHNASIYGCLDKIHLVDACFFSPPWGSPDYLTYKSYSLAQMTPDGFEIVRRVADRVTKNISFLLPRNFDALQDVSVTEGTHWAMLKSGKKKATSLLAVSTESEP
ncbi:Trimethylguanosine synthase [Tyrophagus putrescentiae]|nr:Trimethylguanosine synthase [Tyrophagus putrescentiae]